MASNLNVSGKNIHSIDKMLETNSFSGIIDIIKRRIENFKNKNPVETIKISEEIGFDYREEILFHKIRFYIAFFYLKVSSKQLFSTIDISFTINEKSFIDSLSNIKLTFLGGSLIYTNVLSFSNDKYYNKKDRIFIIPILMTRTPHELRKCMSSPELLAQLEKLSKDKDFCLIFNKLLGFEFSPDRSCVWFHT